MEFNFIHLIISSLLVLIAVDYLGYREPSPLTALVVALTDQVLIYMLRGSGEIIMLPGEYIPLYTTCTWIIYSAAKAALTYLSSMVSGLRRLGSWLVILFALQATLSLINAALSPPLKTCTISLNNYRLSAIVADTQLRESCGYYCWPRADAILFIDMEGHKSIRVTMNGISNSLLLIAVSNGTIYMAKLLRPWHTYTVNLYGSLQVIETRHIEIAAKKGSRIRLLNCQ